MSKVYKKSTGVGGKGGQVWDDDVYEGVRKVYVGQDENRITYVKFEYVNEKGNIVTTEHGKENPQPKEFVVEYPDEHIIAVEGVYNTLRWSDIAITNLLFKTSKGRQSLVFGPNVTSGKKFLIEDGGKKIVGFHGRFGNGIDAFGVYFVHDPLPPLYKLEAQGGTGGSLWDDGSYDDVKSLTIGKDDCRITYLEFEYEKNGKLETHQHGKKGKKPLEKFVLNPDEYIKSVEATYDLPEVFGRDNKVITSLKFETSEGRKSAIYGYENSLKSKKFVLEQEGGRIVGFHGAEGSAIDAIGAYFTLVPTPVIRHKKLAAQGGKGGDLWDDGVYDDVKRILVGQGHHGVAFVKFEYSKGKVLVLGDDHGKMTILGTDDEFVLEDGEYLTSVDVYYDTVYEVEAPLIIGLKFKTNKKESSNYGLDAGHNFTFEEKDHKIVGFHGQAGVYVHSIGVNVVPITTTTT